MSDEPSKNPKALIADCVLELQMKGFLNLIHNQSEKQQFEVIDQKKRLREYILKLLEESKKAL